MRRILVTGGCGMIGSNLVKRLVALGDDVYVIDNLWRGRLDYLNGDDALPVIDFESHFFNIDLTQNVPILDDVISKVEFVVHLADVVAGIDYVFSNQGYLFRVNNQINSNLFAAVRRAGKDNIKGILYVGTACSYPLTRQNSLKVIPLREEELFPAMPESAYGWSKLMGQLEMGYLERETGISCCTLQFHNVYGSPCDYGLRSQVIPALIRKAVLYPNEPFVVWGSGEQRRAFIHVRDVVDALVMGLEKGWGQGWIQIGPSECTSVREIAESIIRISQKDIKPIYDMTKPEGDKARSADWTKACKVLGWEPKVSLDNGLREQYQWVKSRIEETANLD